MKCEYEAGDRKCDKEAVIIRQDVLLCWRHFHLLDKGIEWVRKMEYFERKLRLS